MAENNPAAIDYEKLGAAIAGAVAVKVGEALATALKPVTESQKAVADAVAAMKPAESDPAKAGKKAEDAAPGVTLKDIEKMFEARDQKAATAQQRSGFITQHLAKLPRAYQDRLGSDPSKWDAEAKAIQSEYEADFKTTAGAANGGANGAGENKGGATVRDGGTPASQATVDKTKISPVDRIAMGLTNTVNTGNAQQTATATAK